MPTPTQTTRKNVTVRYVANGRKFNKPMLIPAHQNLGWVVNASGVVPLHAELAAAQAEGKLAYGIANKVFPAISEVPDGALIDVYAPVNPQASQQARTRKAVVV